MHLKAICAARSKLGGCGPLRLNRFGLAAKAASNVPARCSNKSLCLAVVDGSRRHVADTRMAVLVVVPREELLAMGSGIFDAAESRGEVGPVLDRLSAPMRCNFFATAPPPPVTRRNV